MRVILLLKFNEYPKIQRKLKNPTFTIKKEKCYRGQIIPRRQLELYDMVLKIGEYRNTAIFERVYDKKKTDYSIKIVSLIWQGQKDLNPRHSVLETDALPTELYPYMKRTNNILTYGSKKVNSFFLKNIKVFSETQFFITK